MSDPDILVVDEFAVGTRSSGKSVSKILQTSAEPARWTLVKSFDGDSPRDAKVTRRVVNHGELQKVGPVSPHHGPGISSLHPGE
jgi:hypothetical protein